MLIKRIHTNKITTLTLLIAFRRIIYLIKIKRKKHKRTNNKKRDRKFTIKDSKNSFS